jgi:hypothetical protein
MDFPYKCFHVVISLLIWAVAALVLCFPIRVIWNHSIFHGAPVGCVTSFCSLLIVGWIVVLLRKPPERKV